MAATLPAPFHLLHDRVQEAARRFGLKDPTPPQVEGIPKVLRGGNVLILAPTGTGKTEAALLPVLDRLLREEREGIGLLYITPLRALNRDMQLRLERWCAALGLTVSIRHGDTPQKDRRKQAAKPPDVLITTPETLQAILPAKVMRRHLRDVRHVVVDEIHQLSHDRRGVQLMVGLERLREATGRDFQRVGLSATVGGPEEIARFLGGGAPVEVVEVSAAKQMSFAVEWPRPNEEDFESARELYISPEAAASINLMADAMEPRRSALVFVNSRNTAELLGHRFSLLSRAVAVHHGWLPREERERAEGEFKAGHLKALVCTSTLELGIDVGAVDLVLQYMSPRQVTSLIQRVGRAGHSLDRVSEGVIVSVHSDDTVESLAAIRAARAGDLEPPKIHRGARDVVAHQVVGAVLDEGGRRSVESIWNLVRRAEPFADFPRDAFDRVVDFLVHLKLLRGDGDELASTSNTRNYYFTNLSTIRDERRYRAVDLATQQPVGVLGEEFMMVRARAGYNFIVKGRTWKIQKIADDGTIYVNAISDPTAALPGWDGEMLPVPHGLAMRAGAIRGELDAAAQGGDLGGAAERLGKAWPVNRTAVKRLLQEAAGHRATGAPMPTDRRLLLEGFGRFLILHAHFGEVVNETLGDLLEELLARKNLVRFWWADAYHILYELVVDSGDLDLRALAGELFGLDDAELERSLNILTEEHLPIGYYMKFVAERFGALQRGLMVAADELNSIQLRFAHTPIEEEGLREAMLLHADYDAVRRIFRDVRSGAIELATHRSIETPTPLAYHILQRIVEAPELFTPEAEKDASLERMRMHVDSQLVNFLCFGCGAFHEGLRVGALPDAPTCSACGSRLLGVLNWSAWSIRDAFARKQRKEELGGEQRKALTRVRQTADLVAVYGRRAVVAHSVYGVGPQTAGKILARMHDDERAFLEDLFEAKLQYITTRPYWDERNRGGPAVKTLYTGMRS